MVLKIYIHMINYQQNFYIKLLSVALIIFSAKLLIIHNFGSQVPFFDQWGAEAANLYLPWLNNNLTLNHLFDPHNEHRIFFSRILSLSLLILNDGQWDPMFGMVVNALISTSTAIFLIIILNKLLEKKFQNIILFTICLIWSIPYGWGNIIASFQSAFYIMLLFTIAICWGLLLHDNFSLKWWIGATLAFLITFTIASGFLILLVIFVIKAYLILIDTGNRKYHLPTLFLIIASIIISLLLIVRVSHHEVLIANNITEFMLTFSKSLAWPWVTHPFVSLLLYLPFLVFVFRMLWLRQKPSKAELFVLALGGWVILQSASIAYARGAGGMTPVSRYMDILALGIIINLLSLIFISSNLPRWTNPYLNIYSILWKFLIIFGIGNLVMVSSWPGMQLRNQNYNEYSKNIREFIRTSKLETLQKPNIIPHPNAEFLASLLSNPKLRAILPHRLAIPPILQSDNSITFIKNGFYPTTEKYLNETTLGSYSKIGNPNVGKFVSKTIKSEHSFIEISVAGYLGKQGLSLQLIIDGQEKPINIIPPELAGKSWVSCYIPVPKQPFKLVATDNRPDLWFAFAMPRNLGKLSFTTIKIFEYKWFFLLIGISLLFISFYPQYYQYSKE